MTDYVWAPQKPDKDNEVDQMRAEIAALKAEVARLHRAEAEVRQALGGILSGLGIGSGQPEVPITAASAEEWMRRWRIRTEAAEAEVAQLTQERDEAQELVRHTTGTGYDDPVMCSILSLKARIEAAEAERDALRKRIAEGDVMWELHNELYDSLDAIDIRLRDDAERVLVLAEPDPEVTP